MAKVKFKKRGGAWLVYRNKKEIFKCYNERTAIFYYNFLMRT